ncbi:MAG: hypothetical protein Q9163_000668 [Psora crenata]
MLNAAMTAALRDAFDDTCPDLEQHVAALCGKPAALFCISGTMANQIALRCHLFQPPMAILADYRSHILNMEAGGMATLTGALIQAVTPKNGVYMTLDDVRRCAVLKDDLYSCPTRVIVIENPHAGSIMPLSEFKAIAAFAHSHGIRVHVDGARLWEAVAAGAGTLREFCSVVDSVSMCFTKGLCAPAGSILVGSRECIAHARKVRKSIGGAMRQPGIAVAMAMAGLREIFEDAKPGKRDGLRRGHEMAKEIAQAWTGAGGRVSMPVQTNMVCLDLEAAGIEQEAWVRGGKERGLKLRESRIVMHYQIDRDAIDTLKTYIRDTLARTEQA